MRKLHYHRIDVFTDRPFGGNPLAVFPNGRGVSTELMQAIAKEFNLSETTFVLPPDDRRHDYRLRIFTPSVELPMAGHPTVGTTFVLAREHMVEPPDGASEMTITLEEGVGPVPVRIEFADGQPVFAEMRQPLPTFGPRFDNIEAVAEMLSVRASDISDTGLPVEVVSCGVPFLYVPLTNLAAIGRARFRLDVWERLFSGQPLLGIFLFTREVERAGSSVHSRMFAPEAGITEDPATGGASGPLGCYLVHHKVFETGDRAEFTSEQGFEMGRPSLIKIGIEQQAGEITGVRVGGECCYMGEGFIEVQ